MNSFYRSNIIRIAGALLTGFLLSACNPAEENTETSDVTAPPEIVELLRVYKSETCGCCGKWVEHMEANGFPSAIHHPEDLNAVKDEFGIAPALQSCHTAVSEEGYVFEGHIPAKFVKQFLDNVPEGAAGLAVPGMPLGSPGMEVDDRFMAYDILLLKDDGTSEVYVSVASAEQQF